MAKYNPHKIEKKWQEIWEKEKAFVFDEGKKALERKFYVLDMFPYPSHEGLHVGQPMGYIGTDIIAHYQRMRGFNVLHPMGWDALGLPAENYAIKIRVHPKETTAKSTENFKRQLKTIGLSYDWSREISTADPAYYKWTQWLFLHLYEKGIAYRKKAPVNWCPGCQTVLANEQVIAGDCELCDSKVIQKELEQWFFKITDYVERLLSDLENVDWPEKIKLMQKNWIGKSSGSLLNFEILNSKFEIDVFTTRPDTLFGATYLVLAPEHVLVDQLVALSANQTEARKYIEQASHKTELERKVEDKVKSGIRLEGVVAINPANGEEIPVFMADYVLAGYGTGAIMAVPAHDERDFEFAKKFGLKIKEVITGGELPYIGEGKMVNSGELNGMSSQEARDKITSFVKGKKEIVYKIRDWLISRQRYWGAPIPIIYCEECGMQPVPLKDLPVKLPDDVDFLPKGESPLKRSKSFQDVKCPKCQGPASREADTMDTFVDSAWYFLRYIDPDNRKEAFSTTKANKILPVDLYVGGAEHAVLHLLYARFITKVLADSKLVNFSEPFLKLRNQGLILGPDGQKMSKSRGNVVNPDEVIEEFGADSFRLYEMFMGPFEHSKPWNTRSIIGVFRFLTKVWNLTEELEAKGKNDVIAESPILRKAVHQTIFKVENDIIKFAFNTAISALMVLLAKIEKEKSLPAFRTFLLLLYPFAPHLAAEAWQKLSLGETIWQEPWPEVTKKFLREDEITVIVQVDGKVRDTILLPSGMGKEELEKAARGLKNVENYLKEKRVKNIVVVLERLVNFVTKKKDK